MIDPSIITTAFVGTCIVFACFSAASLFASKRSMLYLGGFLGSGLSLMVMVGFMNIFMRSSWLLSFQLYGGLLLFCGFIMFGSFFVRLLLRLVDAIGAPMYNPPPMYNPCVPLLSLTPVSPFFFLVFTTHPMQTPR